LRAKGSTLYNVDSCTIHMPLHYYSFRRGFVSTPKMLHGISFALLKTGNIACVMLHLPCSFMNLHKNQPHNADYEDFFIATIHGFWLTYKQPEIPHPPHLHLF